MIVEDQIKEDSNWPLPKFRFEIDFGTDLKSVAFEEVSGLETETQTIDNGESDSPLYFKVKGNAKFSKITLKRGKFINKGIFWNWYQQFEKNTKKRQTFVIKLIDETGAITLQWQLNNAFPRKITAIDLKEEGNEIVIDSIEISYENLSILNR